MINDSVNNLTHAICNQSIGTGDRVPSHPPGMFSLGSVRRHPAVLRTDEYRIDPGEAEHQLAREIEDGPTIAPPGSRSGSGPSSRHPIRSSCNR